jgi:hypothetical protein
MVPATAVNAADAAPADTLTEAGTIRAVVLLERETVTPPELTACEIVTVQ